MIIGAEVAMLVMGAYILFGGKILPKKNAKHIVRGWPLRVIGIIYLLPIPISLLAGMGLAVWGIAREKDVASPSFFWIRTALEGSIVAACLLAVYLVGRAYRIPVEKPEADTAQV